MWKKNSVVIEGKTGHARGKVAEQAAAEYLKRKGMQILEMRYKRPTGEIDVIAQEGQIIVAVEVKFRQTLEAALEAVTPKAQRRIAKTLMGYMVEKNLYERCLCRFDVVAVTPPLCIHHLDNAWNFEA